jgi:hypothetical protein
LTLGVAKVANDHKKKTVKNSLFLFLSAKEQYVATKQSQDNKRAVLGEIASGGNAQICPVIWRLHLKVIMYKKQIIMAKEIIQSIHISRL